MLDRHALYFARADYMLDPWEGRIGEFNEAAHLRVFREGNRARDDSVELRSSYRTLREQARARMFLSCWYMAEHESAAMWELYAGREGRGIAIRSRFDAMEAALPPDFPHSIYAGTVRYVDYNRDEIPVGNSFYPFVHKRLSYQHEQELRLVIDTHPSEGEDTPQGLNVPVDLERVVEHIHVAPTAQDWFVELVKRTVSRSAVSADVTRSDLLTGPVV